MLYAALRKQKREEGAMNTPLFKVKPFRLELGLGLRVTLKGRVKG